MLGALAALPQAQGVTPAVTAAGAGRTSPASLIQDRLAPPGTRQLTVRRTGPYLPRHSRAARDTRPPRRLVVRHVAHPQPHPHPRLHPSPATPAGPACSGSGGMLPSNYATIVSFLTSHGYTGIAAAGIAGNIYQESMGNPESVGTGGGGLIGWTPLPAGFVTGNPAADLQTQLNAILAYNQQWPSYLPALNAATSAAQAADIYMNDFERPGIPAAANREAAAAAVAAACRL